MVKPVPLLLMLTLTAMACKKGGSIVHAKAPDAVKSVTGYAGRNRVKLTWELPDNSTAQACVIRWDGGADSVRIPIAGEGHDNVIVTNLPEGSHTFVVSLVDEKGGTSASVSVKVSSYGPEYQNSLHNRGIAGANYQKAAGTVTITWLNAAAGTTVTEIRYKDSLGVSRVFYVPVYMSSTTIKGLDFAKDSLLRYRSLFLPELHAIDTFYTAYDTLSMKPSDGNFDDYTKCVLKADGKTDTYTLLNKVLGGDAEETPDCSHPAFGPHIRQEFNTDLGEYVFAFYLHVHPDNDRCVNFDRQRCEIKTYGPSADSIKGFNGDQMVFQWKFRLDGGFQPSKNFTHIHQIKAGDGPNDGSPLITVTPRYGTPDKLQIIHNGDTKGSTLGVVKEVDLQPFLGTWVEAEEKITFGSHGTYSLTLSKVSDGTVLLSYTNGDIDLWRTGSTFIRPKWGIYRSLDDSTRLRDEKVLFADFILRKKK